jgi:hypothetical protein
MNSLLKSYTYSSVLGKRRRNEIYEQLGRVKSRIWWALKKKLDSLNDVQLFSLIIYGVL